MSRNLSSLLQLLGIKQKNTQKAFQEVINAQEEFKKNKLKHEQLVGYRGDYLQQMESLGEQGASLNQIRHRVDFIAHLDKAIIQLNGHLAHLAKLRQHAQTAYLVTKREEESIQLLIEKLKKEQAVKESRREQKENDEYAQKQWYSKRINQDVEPIE
ncbi:MAG: flagellar export protein FliJ [Legionella sp. 40-6]|nr:flagellar export protein FliJ [Legionella sp.]OJX93787.1 MAG: flagellar export protein FliJ [Legionella sp. 40-6]